MGSDRHLHVGPGGHIQVHAASAHYAACVIDDLCRIANAPEGCALLAECDALGHRIRIVRPETPLEPPNGIVEPENRSAATARGGLTGQEGPDGDPVLGTGAGCGSHIYYDPAEWPWQGDPTSPSGARVLLVLLQQARTNAKGADDPTNGLTCVEEGG